MACTDQRETNESQETRTKTVRDTLEQLSRDLASGKARVVVGPQGAVTFTGAGYLQGRKITDACAYRRIMATGSALARAAIAKAELLSGRSVDKRATVHSHDGGASWEGNH